jgi:hypothetical protein
MLYTDDASSQVVYCMMYMYHKNYVSCMRMTAAGTAEVYKLTSRQDVGGCVLGRQGTSGKQQQRDKLERTTS